MTSKLDIYNMAIAHLGGEFASSTSEDSVEAQACDERYDEVRKSVLELRPWNFAIKRAQLAAAANAPDFGYDTYYTLPSDMLRILASDAEIDSFYRNGPMYSNLLDGAYYDGAYKDNYKIEINPVDGSLALLSDDDEKRILYVFNQEDTSKFSPSFVETLALALAIAISYKVTGSSTMKERLTAQYTAMLKDASTIDAQQGTTESTRTSAWMQERFNG